MSDYGKIGEGIGNMIVFMAVLLLIFIPLGAWKLIEIIICICNHIKIV